MITTNSKLLRGDPPLANSSGFAGCLCLDPASKSLVATLANWKGTFNSESALHRRVFLFPVPNETKSDDLVTFLTAGKTLELCETICDGYSTDYDGERRFGKLTQEAEDALSALIRCAANPAVHGAGDVKLLAARIGAATESLLQSSQAADR